MEAYLDLISSQLTLIWFSLDAFSPLLPLNKLDIHLILPSLDPFEHLMILNKFDAGLIYSAFELILSSLLLK